MDQDQRTIARPVPGAGFPNLRHLLALEAIGQTGSLVAAAEAVHLSQPALSQALAGLEASTGVRLFHRSKAGMAPTEAGSLCLARTGRLLGHIRLFCTEAGRGHKPAMPLERLITSAQLRALVAVVDHGSFPLAARALSLAQPTLLRAARELEQIVARILFEKSSFGVRPSREAIKLARPIRLAFHEWRQALADLADLSGKGGGRTVIGAMPLARSWLVPHAIAAFQEKHPHHQVAILEGAYESLLTGLLDGDIDFLVGALRTPEPASVRQDPLFDDALAIIARPGHPLTGTGSKRLADYPWVVPRLGSPLRHQLNQLFAEAGEALPERQVECNSLTAARTLLIEGNYLMLLSARQVRYELETGLLAAISHPGCPAARTIGLSFRQNWQPAKAQEILLGHLRGAAQFHVPHGAG